MSTQRIVGIVMVVAGVVLGIIGLNASDSMADQVTETFTGKYTDSTMWYMIGGGALALLGILLTIFKGGKSA